MYLPEASAAQSMKAEPFQRSIGTHVGPVPVMAEAEEPAAQLSLLYGVSVHEDVVVLLAHDTE